MQEAYIVSACRTPVGKFLGGLSGLRAPELGAVAIREAISRARIPPTAVEEVIFGNVLQAGVGQNPARQAARAAGLPDSIGSVTINKVCGSGLKSVMLAAQAIRAGDADCIVAGGMESMSQAPYLLPQARLGVRLGHGKLLDALVHDGLWDVYNDFHMGNTGELVAKKYGVSREEQDRFALESHQKAAAATKNGKFRAEIVAVEVPGPKGSTARVEADEGIRTDATPESLAKLKPAFDPEGTVTPGNASQISDGASALVVVSERKAKELGLKPLARILAYGTGGCAPEWVMMAPEIAVKSLCKRQGWNIADFDLVELNEAFAVQAVALRKVLEIPSERLNVHGGAVALGHPIGCSGARVLTTLLYVLKDRGGKRGLASLCLGGGNAVAMAVEHV